MTPIGRRFCWRNRHAPFGIRKCLGKSAKSGRAFLNSIQLIVQARRLIFPPWSFQFTRVPIKKPVRIIYTRWSIKVEQLESSQLLRCGRTCDGVLQERRLQLSFNGATRQGTTYAPHSHPEDQSHWILAGQLELRVGNESLHIACRRPRLSSCQHSARRICTGQ
jgi:hypothetical protein